MTIVTFAQYSNIRIIIDMERKEVLVDQVNEKQLIDSYKLFEFKVVEKKTIGSKFLYILERDDSVPYYQELVKLENTYPKFHIGSMLPVVILPGFGFITLTIFLVIFFANGMSSSLMPWFIVFIVVAALFLMAAVLFLFLRMTAINKIEKEKPKIDQEFKKKIEALK